MSLLPTFLLFSLLKIDVGFSAQLNAVSLADLFFAGNEQKIAEENLDLFKAQEP